MRITLVQPPLTLIERYGVKHQSGGETIPLGLVYLAASAREKGFGADIIDAEILNLNISEAAEKILETTTKRITAIITAATNFLVLTILRNFSIQGDYSSTITK